MKKALISGITGQDGSYLSEFLLSKKYEVHGIIRRSSSINTSRIDDIYQEPFTKKKNFILHYGDLSDGTSIFDALVMDAMNFKEYNSHTSQVSETLYEVGTEVGETMVDVADQVEDVIEDVEISPNQILNLEE